MKGTKIMKVREVEEVMIFIGKYNVKKGRKHNENEI